MDHHHGMDHSETKRPFAEQAHLGHDWQCARWRRRARRDRVTWPRAHHPGHGGGRMPIDLLGDVIQHSAPASITVLREGNVFPARRFAWLDHIAR